ncbi:UNVERIFIED_CONTAM: hypothetical protein RMT77_007333 [Armadillidium vulgare]
MTSMFKLIFSLLLFNAALCQNQIFFPRESPIIEPPCVAYDGRPGICRLLVQCATFFAEIAELSRSPCLITEVQNGVCCPPTKQQTKDPGSLVVKEPHGSNREIIFPNVTPQDLDNSAQNSIIKFEQRIVFTQDLVNRNIIAPPNTPVFWHSRLFETTNEIFKKGQDATLVLETSKDLMKSFNLNKEQAEIGLPNFNVLGTVIKDTCPPGPRCPDPGFAYRTMDGSCNNIEHPDWGKTGVAFTRMILPNYEDGISEPRLSASKKPLPSPRLVSAAIAPPISDVYNNLTILIWQWGQFVDHDITHTPISKGANKADISCCTKGQIRQGTDLHPECMPIEIPPNDNFFGRFNQKCMEFVRSMPAIRPECKLGSREQMNQITSYMDGSNVYGSTDKEAAALRAFQGGLLKVSMHQGRELLPGNDTNVGCARRKNTVHKCFVAGDTRVNEQPDLAVMHTVWMRQHNKIVRELARLNPGWSDQVLYQEGRRIVVAQMQHITYNEYLSIVLGREFMETFGLLPLKKGYFRGYRNDVDATIMNAFAAAAFRYGHTLITDQIQGFGKFGNLKETMDISRFQFLPFALYDPGMLDALIRGLSLQQSQKFDRFFSDQLTNKLFSQGRDFGMDLVSLNLQRGRDHGLPPYPKWREACALPKVNDWNDLLQDMDPEVVNQLRSIYESVHDIDLFIGGISEKIIRGSLLGPTFLCIIGRQFIKLKIGDRFYYENGNPSQNNSPGNLGEPQSSFTEGQLKEIRKTSLARILCDNSDNVELMQPLAFVSAHLANKRAVCNTDVLIPKMSLDPWENSQVFTQ